MTGNLQRRLEKIAGRVACGHIPQPSLVLAQPAHRQDVKKAGPHAEKLLLQRSGCFGARKRETEHERNITDARDAHETYEKWQHAVFSNGRYNTGRHVVGR